ERAEVLTLLHEPHRQSPPRLNEHGMYVRPLRQLKPGQIRAEENEPQIVHIPVMLPMLQQLGIVFRPFPPLGLVRRSQAAADFPEMELPHHSGQESTRPIGPEFAAMMPLAA